MLAGKMRGRVVADSAYPVQGLMVHIKTMSTAVDQSYWAESSFLSAEETVTTDSQGRFDIPTIAYGWMKIEIPNGLNKEYQYRTGEPMEFRQGDFAEVVVRLRKAVHVHGVLRLFGSDVRPTRFQIVCGPIGDYTPPIVAGYATDDFGVNIDGKGRFDYYALPGEQWLGVKRREDPIFSFRWAEWIDRRRISANLPARMGHSLNYLPGWEISIPRNAEDFECPAMEIAQVRGFVADENGHAVPQASVRYDIMDGSCGTGRVGGHWWYEGIADEHGDYSLWLDPRQQYHFQFSAKGRELQQFNYAVLSFPDVVLPHSMKKMGVTTTGANTPSK